MLFGFTCKEFSIDLNILINTHDFWNFSVLVEVCVDITYANKNN